jgi:hypothetical protein
LDFENYEGTSGQLKDDVREWKKKWNNEERKTFCLHIRLGYAWIPCQAITKRMSLNCHFW